MSRQYDNTNRGALFKNKDKTADTHADYQGNLNVNGQEFFIDAWLNTSNDGKTKYMALKPKQARDTPGAVAHKTPDPGFGTEPF